MVSRPDLLGSGRKDLLGVRLIGADLDVPPLDSGKSVGIASH
jgi:hypothetical protein